MKLYNSYSQTIEELKPIEPGKISMYVCGPTVYNYPHIGNARPIVVFDTLKKALSAQGYEVTFASNYTDVDDKIIKTAIEQNVTEKEITDKFMLPITMYVKVYMQIFQIMHLALQKQWIVLSNLLIRWLKMVQLIKWEAMFISELIVIKNMENCLIKVLMI